MAPIVKRVSGRDANRGLVRWLLAAIAAIAVAWLAAWLLRSRGMVTAPAPTHPGDWFSVEELDRMISFRRPQRLLGVAAVLIEISVLMGLAWWAPPRLERLWTRHPLLVSAGTGAAISLLLVIVTTPIGLIGLERSVDFGLSHQDVPSWLADRARAGVIGALIAAAGAALAVFLFRRMGRRWWLGGTAVIATYAVLVTWLAPVFIAPLFNRFEPLPEGPARQEIIALADAAGVKVKDVMTVDAGRRSNSINAYVTGLGSSRRVVVYDNALKELRLPELRAILAHELSHVKGRDVQRGVLWVILVAPMAVLAVQGAAVALVRMRGGRETGPAVVPVLALCLSLAVLVLGIPGRELSRQLEARADSFALELTGDPDAFIRLQTDLARNNLSDPDPPRLWRFVFATHPATMERIGAALSFGKSERGPGEGSISLRDRDIREGS